MDRHARRGDSRDVSVCLHMMTSETTGADRSAPPTRGELIRSTLDGKVRALSNYDSIIWKIRVGYAIVIFGSLTLLLGKEGSLVGKEGSLLGREASIIEDAVWSAGLFILVCGFSLAGGWLDYEFSKRKRRVVISRDKLVDYLWDEKLLDDGDQKLLDNGDEKILDKKRLDKVRELLHISGEATGKLFYVDQNSSYREDLRSSAYFFCATPLVLLILLSLLLIYRFLKPG
jgi:hypothetical protein